MHQSESCCHVAEFRCFLVSPSRVAAAGTIRILAFALGGLALLGLALALALEVQFIVVSRRVAAPPSPCSFFAEPHRVQDGLPVFTDKNIIFGPQIATVGL